MVAATTAPEPRYRASFAALATATAVMAAIGAVAAISFAAARSPR
jgi:hypothetical protein